MPARTAVQAAVFDPIACGVLFVLQLKVLHRDLQICAERSTGVDQSGQFRVGDLVQLE